MIDRSSVEIVRRDRADPGRPGPFARSIAELRAALAMLTRIPVGDPVDATGARAYAVVGTLVGLAGSIPLVAFGGAVPAIAAILAVATISVVSGAIHLDGLADTADALVAVGPDATERARADPAVGVGGAVALVLVLALEAVSLTTLLTIGGPLVAALACVVATTLSRVVPVAVVRLVPPPSGHGLGGWFAVRVGQADAAIALITGLAIAGGAALALGQPTVLLAGLVGGLGAVGLSVVLVRVRRQLDGDLLGAGVELAFGGTVTAAAVLASWPTR